MSTADINEAMRQLTQLEKDGMTPETKTKVYTAMAKQAVSSKDDIVAEVTKLAERAVATDSTFESIRTQLLVVDQNNYKDKFGQPIAKYAPTWVKYQKRYTALLWKSRSAATRAEAYLRDFTQVIIPLILAPDSTYEDNLKDLQAFIARPNPTNPTVQADDFAKLKTDVEAFSATFSAFAEDKGAELTSQIKALNDEIKSLKTELVGCDKLVTQMGIALGVTAGAATIGVIVAVSALGPAAPAAVVAILIAGIGAAIGELSQLIAALVRKTAIESDIASDQRQIDEANKQLEELGRIKSTLQRIAEEGSEMFGRLDSFTNIWDLAAQDARLIVKSDLASVHSDKTVQAKIKLIQDSYAALIVALAEYATRIDESDLEPEDSEKS